MFTRRDDDDDWGKHGDARERPIYECNSFVTQHNIHTPQAARRRTTLATLATQTKRPRARFYVYTSILYTICHIRVSAPENSPATGRTPSIFETLLEASAHRTQLYLHRSGVRAVVKCTRPMPRTFP